MTIFNTERTANDNYLSLLQKKKKLEPKLNRTERRYQNLNNKIRSSFGHEPQSPNEQHHRLESRLNRLEKKYIEAKVAYEKLCGQIDITNFHNNLAKLVELDPFSKESFYIDISDFQPDMIELVKKLSPLHDPFSEFESQQDLREMTVNIMYFYSSEARVKLIDNKTKEELIEMGIHHRSETNPYWRAALVTAADNKGPLIYQSGHDRRFSIRTLSDLFPLPTIGSSPFLADYLKNYEGLSPEDIKNGLGVEFQLMARIIEILANQVEHHPHWLKAGKI